MTNATLALGDRRELAPFVVGILAVIGAAYYTGATGNWRPLLFASFGTSLLVLGTE